ncbi:MAG: cytochrome P450 [Magnetovibrionaceae bacterium]
MNEILKTPTEDQPKASPTGTAPGPLPRIPGHGFLGNLPDMRRDPLTFSVRAATEGGPVAEIDLGMERILLVSDPEAIKHVLLDNYTNYHKTKFIRMLRPMVGNGIMLAEDDQWLFQRRATAKGFQGPKMARMVDGMVSATHDMLNRWEDVNARGATVDIAPEMMRVTFDVILRGLYNYVLKDEYVEIYAALSHMLRETEKRIWSFLPVPRWMPTPGNRRFDAGQKVLQAFIDRIIDERRANPDVEPDFLTILMEAYGKDAGRALPPHLVRDEALAFALAGHDTTANALAWTFVLLSRHPEIQNKVAEEVDRVLEGRAPTFEDINNLTYVRQVIDEAMRLYPPVWTFSRTALTPDTVGGYDIKHGENLMISPWALHRRPDLFPNPEGFDPDRFSAERAEGRHRFAFIPFGAGPRVCMGARFSVMEAIVLLAMVTQKYRLELLPGQSVIEPEPMITLRPKGRVLMTLKSA